MNPAALSISEQREYEGLHFLSRIVGRWQSAASAPHSPGHSDAESFWIQCDRCWSWRKGVNAAPYSNGLCQRWFCRDAGRSCADPCDYCRVHNCTCTPSDSYRGYSTSGYSLPDGFSVLIRFRHADDIEIGKPWLTYRSWCQACGMKSKGMDRQGYMHKWLADHQMHNTAWRWLTPEAFDFKVDAQTRELYMTYVKLHKRGVLEKGIRDTVKEGDPRLTQGELEALKELLEMADASRFFDEKEAESGRLAGRKTPKRRLLFEGTGVNGSQMLLPVKRSVRKTRPPQWLASDAQWVVDDVTGELETPAINSSAAPLHTMQCEESLMETAEEMNAGSVLAGQLLGSVTRRKDRESLVVDLPPPMGAPMLQPPIGNRVMTTPVNPYVVPPGGFGWRPQMGNGFADVAGPPVLGIPVTDEVLRRLTLPFLSDTSTAAFLTEGARNHGGHYIVQGHVAPSQRTEHPRNLQPSLRSMGHYHHDNGGGFRPHDGRGGFY